jgi:GntR family transcriptional regulator, transcriptional repressor for pyruvate dehydrogenase complex
MKPKNSKTQFRITPLPRRRVSEAVADNLRQGILNGKLLPGHKLPSEREMAALYRTSRVALREALRTLENEGLIIIKRGFRGGACVSDFDNALRALRDSLRIVVKLGQAKSSHLTEVRGILEPEIAAIATVRASSSDLQAIEAIVVAQEEELGAGKLSRRYDMEFHRCAVEATHNPVLSIVVNAINESLRESIFRSKLNQAMRTRVVTNHRNIFEALRSRNAEEAQRLMSEHVLNVQQHLEAGKTKQSSAKMATTGVLAGR